MPLRSICLQGNFDFQRNGRFLFWQKVGIGVRCVPLIQAIRICRHPLGDHIANHRREIRQLHQSANRLRAVEFQLKINGVERLVAVFDASTQHGRRQSCCSFEGGFVEKVSGLERTRRAFWKRPFWQTRCAGFSLDEQCRKLQSQRMTDLQNDLDTRRSLTSIPEGHGRAIHTRSGRQIFIGKTLTLPLVGKKFNDGGGDFF